jgi:hypothetical protein
VRVDGSDFRFVPREFLDDEEKKKYRSRKLKWKYGVKILLGVLADGRWCFCSDEGTFNFIFKMILTVLSAIPASRNDTILFTPAYEKCFKLKLRKNEIIMMDKVFQTRYTKCKPCVIQGWKKPKVIYNFSLTKTNLINSRMEN